MTPLRTPWQERREAVAEWILLTTWYLLRAFFYGVTAVAFPAIAISLYQPPGFWQQPVGEISIITLVPLIVAFSCAGAVCARKLFRHVPGPEKAPELGHLVRRSRSYQRRGPMPRDLRRRDTGAAHGPAQPYQPHATCLEGQRNGHPGPRGCEDELSLSTDVFGFGVKA